MYCWLCFSFLKKCAFKKAVPKKKIIIIIIIKKFKTCSTSVHVLKTGNDQRTERRSDFGFLLVEPVVTVSLPIFVVFTRLVRFSSRLNRLVWFGIFRTLRT